MNRRKIILILSIVLIIAIGVAIFFALTGKKYIGSPNSAGSGSPPIGSSASVAPASKSAIGADTSTSTSETAPLTIPKLRQLTLVPTSGDIILTRQVDVIKERVKVKETQYFLRYIDRASGHIFDIKTDSPAPLEISNTTIPKVYEAMFTPDGNSIIARLLSEANPDQILTYFITLKDKKLGVSATSTNKTVSDIGILSKTGLKEVSGTYLTPDIKEIALSPSGAKILSLLYTGSGGKITISNPNGSGERTALSHPLREWLLSFVSENKAVLTTKPSGTVNGYAYVLDIASGALSKITGEIAGLTLLPNKDGNTYLGAGTPGSTVKLFAYFAKEDKQTILPFGTFPEKCVWAKAKSVAYCAVPTNIPISTYPDAWYQGRVSFTDEIWKINVATGETSLISNLPKESGQKIDAINMKLADDDSYLTFINKIDLTLWGLNLKITQ